MQDELLATADVLGWTAITHKGYTTALRRTLRRLNLPNTVASTVV
ncbi:hypothetical protein [Herpetosiphon giganteus]|nr:hypothetical protein [Herpetosiphon giganteus]MBM7845352.1 hypothetical protein [Herpetosiphon giganteus]